MNELASAFKQISKVVEYASVASLNRALSAGRTLFQRTIREETGLNTKQVGSRLFSQKATVAIPAVYATIGVKVGINAKYLKPQAIRVTSTDKRSGRSRTYNGVTIKVGNQARYVLPNAWLATVSNGEIIPLVRQGAKRYPTSAVFLDVLAPAALAARPAAQQRMADAFEANLPKLIEYYLSRKDNLTVVDGSGDAP